MTDVLTLAARALAHSQSGVGREATEVRYSTRYELPVEKPIFRNRKEYRRYRVAMKRMQERIDKQIMATIFSDRYGCNPEPPVWPEPQPQSYSPFRLRDDVA